MRFAEHVEAHDARLHVQTHQSEYMPPVTVAAHWSGGHVQTYLTPEVARQLAAHLIEAADVAEAVTADREEVVA